MIIEYLHISDLLFSLCLRSKESKVNILYDDNN